MSGASPSDAGLASGLFNTTQQVGAALGLAVLSTLATARAAGLHAAGLGAPAALTGGYRLAFGVGAGLALAAIVLAAAILRPRAASAADSLRPGAAAADSARSRRRPAGRGMVTAPQGSGHARGASRCPAKHLETATSPSTPALRLAADYDPPAGPPHSSPMPSDGP
jgi:hypothetical protein